MSGRDAPSRPWPALLLVGPTGSGKTPLGDEMERRGLLGRPCVHFDFGANLRSAAERGAGELGLTPGELGEIRASLATGALFEARHVPMIVKILAGFAARRGLEAGGPLLVLNGLPRHPEQAEALSDVVKVERVVSLDADAAVIRARIRRDPGGDRSGRRDDDDAAVARRLADFRARTRPLLDLYRSRDVPVTVLAVTASMNAPEMHRELERLLRHD